MLFEDLQPPKLMNTLTLRCCSDALRSTALEIRRLWHGSEASLSVLSNKHIIKAFMNCLWWFYFCPCLFYLRFLQVVLVVPGCSLYFGACSMYSSGTLLGTCFDDHRTNQTGKASSPFPMAAGWWLTEPLFRWWCKNHGPPKTWFCNFLNKPMYVHLLHLERWIIECCICRYKEVQS